MQYDAKPDYIQLLPQKNKFDLETDRFIQMIRYIIICIARINDKYKARFILRLINDN